jgi:DNA-binding transcriptional LysR family regulator
MPANSISTATAGLEASPAWDSLHQSASTDLVRLFELVPELTRSWRILAHPDRRKTRAVAAFFDVIADEIAALRPILTG